jgi:DUF1365 family protein
VLETWINGVASDCTMHSGRRIILRYGWMTAAVMARIHWQALRLWLKRVPWFAKPSAPVQPLTRS